MNGTTSARRRVIRRILDATPVASQAEIAERLAAEGHPVTQATVSRDLEALGAVKTRTGGSGWRYSIPASPPPTQRKVLARALADYARQITGSGNLAIIKTPPGAAQMVAAAIDGAGIDGVLGTVAGDDTLFVAASEGLGAAGVVAELERIGAST